MKNSLIYVGVLAVVVIAGAALYATTVPEAPNFNEATGISFDTDGLEDSNTVRLIIEEGSWADNQGLMTGDLVLDSKTNLTLPVCEAGMNGSSTSDVTVPVDRGGEALELNLDNVPTMECA